MNPSNALAPNHTNPLGLREAFEICVAKTRQNLPDLARNPSSWAHDPTGTYENWEEGFFDISNWTSSFFTGMGALAFLKTNDQDLIDHAEKLLSHYNEKISIHSADTMHDLGFLYSLYSVALFTITKNNKHRDTALQAANLLADRFIPAGNYFRAWGRMDELDSDYAGLAIIDSLMNMPLLYWASNETGDSRFLELAVRHSDTTLRDFIRDDGSVFHGIRYDLETGAPVSGDNYCGHTVDSHWARGTAWAMYGFALGYRHTGATRYLDASKQLTASFMSSLGVDPVPRWDFDLKSGDNPIRDSSAAAIAACAIQELESLGQATKEMSATKDSILQRLASPSYLDSSPNSRGVLKQGQVSDGNGGARSVSTSWGDYFFMQALAHETGCKATWW